MRSWKQYENTPIRYAGAVGIRGEFGPVKLVRVQFLPTGEKRAQHAVLVCTDPHASARYVIRTYLRHWSIEVEFRNAKSECGLDQFNVRSYTSIVN